MNRLHRSLTVRVQTLRRKLHGLEAALPRISPQPYLLRRTVKLRDAEHRLSWAIARWLAAVGQSVAHEERALERASPARRLPHLKERLNRLADAFPVALRHRVALLDERVGRQEELLAALSYRSVLGRGFSITRIKKGRKLVRSIGQLDDRQRITTELADGEFEADVVNLRQLELFD